MTSLVYGGHRRLSRDLRLFQAAVYHACVRYVELRIFPRTHSQIPSLAPASSAVISSTYRCVHPVRGGPIVRFAQNISLARTVADIRNHESGLALFSRRKGRVRKIQNRDRENPKVAVFQMY